MVRLLIICLFNERRGKERIFVEICYSNRKQVAKRLSFLAFSWSEAKQEKKANKRKKADRVPFFDLKGKSPNAFPESYFLK